MDGTVARALRERAETSEGGGLQVRDASFSADEQLDGEPVVRMTIVLDDPPAGADTWDLAALAAMRRRVNEEAASRGQPHVSVTFLAQSERADAEGDRPEG